MSTRRRKECTFVLALMGQALVDDKPGQCRHHWQARVEQISITIARVDLGAWLSSLPGCQRQTRLAPRSRAHVSGKWYRDKFQANE